MVSVRLPVTESPELERVIAKCLEHDRELRYQHASEIRADLQRLKRATDSAQDRAEGPVEPPASARKKFAVAIAGAALIAAAAGFAYFGSHPARELTNRDSIVLAEFQNKTGDSVFDETLRQGLVFQLNQSPSLSLISDERIQETLRLMGRAAETRLTPEIAREICERTGSVGMVEGSITSLGSRYLLGLRARNCLSGDLLDEEQGQAARKEDVLDTLGQLADRFRKHAGESLATIGGRRAPLERVATSSLEALRAYSLGFQLLASSGHGAALPHFQRAVELDPQFASAYVWLGRMYSGVGDERLGA
jgi:hypothetical protein